MLSYGFVSASRFDAPACGKCFEFTYDGGSHTDSPLHIVRIGSQRLLGKSLIVQATDLDPSLSKGQFDLKVPGGGPNGPDGCKRQFFNARPALDLGNAQGGFLAKCRGCDAQGHCAAIDLGGVNYGKPEMEIRQEILSCFLRMCDAAFERSDDNRYKDWSLLHNSCHWFVNFYEAADEPSMHYREVECPHEIKHRVLTERRLRNRE